MAIEQKWPMVSPQLLTADGGTEGEVHVASTAGFKVKQIVVLQAPTIAPMQVKVQRVISRTQIIVGPAGPAVQGKQNMNTRVDVSMYTVVAGSFIFAAEQDKSKLKPDDILQALYDQEPTVGLRSVLIDQFGDYFDSVLDPNTGQRRLAVDATVNVEINNVQLFTKPFDAITATYPSPTQEVYQSRIGGIAGVVQETVTLNYTDSSKNSLLNVART